MISAFAIFTLIFLVDSVDERDSKISLYDSQYELIGEKYDEMKAWMDFLESEMRCNKFEISDLTASIQLLNRERNIDSFEDFVKKILKVNLILYKST